MALVKVLVVHNQSGHLPSGEAAVACDEVAGLQARGVDVRLHSIVSDPIDSMSAARRAWTAANLMWSVGSMRSVGKIVDEYRPDIVHFHSIVPVLTPSVFYACRRRGVPVVQTLHNFRWLCVEGGLYRNGSFCDDCVQHNSLHGLYHRCARGSAPLSLLLTTLNAAYVKTGLLFRLVDAFIAISNFVKDTYVRKGFPEESIHVKYNGVSVRQPGVTQTSRSGVVFAGRLHGAKGTGHLKHLMAALPNVPFSVLGDGPDAGELRSFVEIRGLGNVSLRGTVGPAEVGAALDSAECAIVPSVCGEALSRVALEAMAAGAPVVGSRIGGLGEILEGNDGAVAVDPANAQEFVEAVSGIVGNEQRVRSMGAAGREFVAGHASADASVQRLIEIYEGVIARRAAGKGA